MRDLNPKTSLPSLIKNASLLLITQLLYGAVAIAGGIPYASQNSDKTSGESGASTRSDESRIALTLTAVIGLPLASSGTSKGIQQEQKKEDQFVARYKQSPLGVANDLRRFRGKHYAWVVQTNLAIPIERRARFRCLLSGESEQLNQKLNKARPNKRPSILAIRGFLKSIDRRASTTSTYKRRCALYARYQMNPQRFFEQLTESYTGTDFDWLRKKYYSHRSAADLKCALKLNRKELRKMSLSMAKRPLRAINKLHNLMKSLDKISKKRCKR